MLKHVAKSFPQYQCLWALTLAIFQPALPAHAGPGVDVLTYHVNNARLGWNANETVLTPTAVSQKTFGKVWHRSLDGDVMGAPLFVSGLSIGGHVTDVVYTATLSAVPKGQTGHNNVYALNAADGKILWATNTIAPSDTGEWSPMGIMSTPVIDREAGTIYVCGGARRGLRFVYQAWALDITSGKIMPGWPVTIHGADRGATFEAGTAKQRGALSLVNGWVYVPFGGFGDKPPWRGWIIGVDTRHPSAPQRLFCTSPDSDGAGIWGAGGLTADDSDALYAVTGNGTANLPTGGDNLAQCILRVTVQDGSLRFSRRAKDYYTPTDYKRLDEEDADLGGATSILLPDQKNSTTPHLLFTGGKDGKGYLINRDNLGGLGAELQTIRLFQSVGHVYQLGIRSTSAYFDAGDAGRFVFVPGDDGPKNKGGLTALRLTNDGKHGRSQLKQTWLNAVTLGIPTAPIVSSDGPRNGIVWDIETTRVLSVLRAFDALSGKQLYSSDHGGPANVLSGSPYFVGPVVANGHVYASGNGIDCYGLMAQNGAGKAGN